MDLKIAAWNVRGLVNRNKQDLVKELMASQNLSVCCILESHTTSSNIRGICDKVFRGWEWMSNMAHCTNWVRIIVGWDPRAVDIMNINQTDQAMHCLVKPKIGHHQFLTSFVYGHVKAPRRRPLWNDLQRLHSTMMNETCVVMGDFNVILHPSERSHGSSEVTRAMDDFKECCNEADLRDLKGSGLHLTWNKSPGNENGLRKKLDRVMTNSNFLINNPNAKATFLPPLTSDHTPRMMTMPNLKKKWVPRSFKFMNFLTRKDGFREVIKEGWQKQWNGYTMFQVVKKLQDLKAPIRKFSREKGILGKKIDALKTELGKIQEEAEADPSNVDLQQEEQAYIEALKQTLIDEELLLKQRSKIKWLREGDQNSKYFHASVKSRYNRGRINSLVGTNGEYY
ncbi:uncharacterized protein LOC143618217 [Bidens hawaiensis]|uniref:uncharacterized protein LOC143618217 n=1 Tax=Bidens hawaiensis TaxID=980011 RepID=UPI004049576F